MKWTAIKCFAKIETNYGELCLLRITENILCRILNADDYLKYFEVILLKFLFINKKWVCFGLYKPSD